MNRDRIKIIQITHDLNIGGLQRAVTDIAINLDKRRYDVSVYALRGGGPFEKELLEEGIKVTKLPLPPSGVDYFSFWKLFNIFKKEKPHLIHTHNTHPFTDGVTAAILAGVPVRIHSDHARQFPDKRRYMLAEWALSHFTDRIIAVSDNTKENLIRYEGIKPTKIRVVQNGIDGRKYQKPIDKLKKRRALGIEEQAGPLLGFCGRLSPEKGITYLLKAMAFLVKEFPNARLLIAGEGSQFDALRDEVESLHIHRNVSFLGPRSDVGEIMGILDLFVLPSLREGLPLVLLEAMAASLPIVATNVGGNRQAVNDGINGLIVRPKDVDALHQAIRRLLCDGNLRVEYGRNSIDLFAKSFTIEKMVGTYEAIYRECLASKGVR